MPAPHSNHGLFSDHYLSRHLRELSGEEAAEEPEGQGRLPGTYPAGVPPVPGAEERACGQRILRPALKVLGFEMDPQPPLRTVESTFKPDYALFADREALDEAVEAGRGEDDFFDLSLAVGEAKRWDRDLGSAERDEEAASKRQHPGAQIRRYLLDSNVRWGILTNGKLWRIYERERSRAGFRYYEVDLPALLEAPVEDFRFFWLLFRRASYQPDESGRSFVGRVLEESRQYWLGITDRLRDRVYAALETLMTGMIEGSDGLSEDDLAQVHEASLIVLYRLLFCFYAEARELLPTSNSVYRQNHSAQTKLAEVAERRDTGGSPWSHSGTGLWQWFRDLSRIINQGDLHETGVPEYDGGLFDPDEWPLLGDPSVSVPDVHMAGAIGRIGRDWDTETDEPAHLRYSGLSVRELGSIYGGLLEMQPHWEDGEVELLTDRGERKATGSYYTPEYIVDYIVTNTLDPLLNDAAEQVKQRLPEFEAEIAEQQQAIDSRPDGDPESAKNLRKIDELKLELLEPYFELMVLDPAMGSGHFLVAASEEITEAIITDPSHLPPADAADEDDENIYYKRRVVERCLYGVDLNPLAVELAKLSLWLHTVEFGKPLSFLKHHLREGNSLIGARLGEMHELPNGGDRDAPQQLNLFTRNFMREATNMLRSFNLIEHMPTDTLVQEREKEAAWEDIERRRERFRQVANVWLSTYFGNEVDDADYARAVDALSNPEAFDDLGDEEWFAQAQSLAREHDFFHWELEFPDAFFTEQGPKREEDRGFDAVVGNPPYGMVPDGQPHRCLEQVYTSTEGRLDIYELFIERGLGLLRRCGGFSYIVPTPLLTNLYARRLRKCVLTTHSVEQVVVFDCPVFRDPTVHSCVLVIRAVEPSDGTSAAVRHSVSAPSELADEFDYLVPTAEFLETSAATIDVFVGPEIRQVMTRMRSLGVPFGDNHHLRQCIKTGDDDQYVKAFAREPGEPWKPTLKGASISRYGIVEDDLYVKYGSWLARNWRNRDFYERPKIGLRETGSRLVATLDLEHRYFLSSLYAIYPSREYSIDKLAYDLSMLNSRCATFYMHAVALAATEGAFTKTRAHQLARLPIRIIDFEHPTEEGLKEEALARCREAVEAGDYETPFVIARAALAAHAAAHGPAGKAELREDEYWAGEIRWLADAAGGDDNGERPGGDVTPHPPNGWATAKDLREDVVHDLLAWLAQRMIDLNEEKHEQKQRFLDWLERRLGCEIEDLNGYTIIQQFDDREEIEDYAELSRRLCQAANRRQMSVDPRRAEYDNLICDAYTDAMETLDEINAQLTSTDALIDRIVYALYGLGDEEIAIIEGERG